MLGNVKYMYQIAVGYGISYQPIHNIFRTIREILFHQTELEGKKLSGQIENDEAYFGGRKKGNIRRRTWSKSVVFGLLERDGRVYTKVSDNLTGSVYFTDQFRSYNSLHQFGKHLIVNHSKTFSTKRHNHINGIEGFWPYVKHKLYNYREISGVNFPLYLKEMEYRFNHRKENIFESIMKLYSY